MKKKIDDNSGYTLVELIIVLAIIVILTTAAFVTMSIMHTAKVKEAAATFDAEITDLIARTRNQDVYQDTNQNGAMDSGEELPGYKYELGISYDGGKYYINIRIHLAQSLVPLDTQDLIVLVPAELFQFKVIENIF